MIECRVGEQRSGRVIYTRTGIGNEQSATLKGNVDERAIVERSNQVYERHVARGERRVGSPAQVLAMISEVCLDLGPARKALHAETECDGRAGT